MKIVGVKAQRILALFLLAILALNPPFIELFDGGTSLTVFGIPPLYLFLYATWGGMIFLLCLASGHLGRRKKP